jgi:putative ABC transport system substrate-binding protein
MLNLKLINRKSIFFFLAAMLLVALCSPSEAQHPAKVARIGYLAISPFSVNSARYAAFRQGLSQLGYTEEKNLVIEWRSGDGKESRVPALAAELVRLKVDVIVTGGPGATRLAKEATKTIPIVMSQDNDPVGNGFVASLARPGGNITGLSIVSPEINGKRLELLKEIVPKLSRATVFGSSSNPGNTQALKEIEIAGQALKVQIQYLDLLSSEDFETAFRTAKKQRADALLVMVSNPIAGIRRKEIAEFAIKSRLPAIYNRIEQVEAGGLMTYGVSLFDLDRRTASYVDKILKGAKPGDLPVEQPTKFELVINLKAAKQIGLTIPPNVLARADRVIK